MNRIVGFFAVGLRSDRLLSIIGQNNGIECQRRQLISSKVRFVIVHCCPDGEKVHRAHYLYHSVACQRYQTRSPLPP